MNDTPGATWITYVGDGKVELPATIDSIRAALPAQRRDEFDSVVGSTPGDRLHQVLAHWALETHPQAVAEVEEEFARLEIGDLSGCVPLDDRENGTGAA
ncbi:hypothetical protein [Streptomyces sp. RFCAC02]|uniref:hypothetical protein n=1 Tax=Streptomyces sp. RFCAC02 TaxID=2499143 RepID=UPI00101FF186|nr:hypothetical protein [Streptomyces sp. RFCAC02]